MSGRPYPDGVEFYCRVVFAFKDFGSGAINKSMRTMVLKTREGDDYNSLAERAITYGREALSRIEYQKAEKEAREDRVPFDPEQYPIVADLPEDAFPEIIEIIPNELPRPRRGWRNR